MKNIISALVVSLCVLFPATQISAASDRQEIVVSAAISLKNAFEEIGEVFEEKYKGTKVNFNFGASGDLARQIIAGAPVDVFASAALKDMDELNQKGLITPGSATSFAANAVVLVMPAMAKSSINTFKDLRKDAVRKIAVGNPKTVPAGRYAEEVFQYYRILDSIKDKLVLTENVRQALDYVGRGEVDAGVVYMTDAIIRAKEIKIVATAPEASHKPAVYPIAEVKATTKQAAARSFIAVVISIEGKKILEKHGFKILR